MEFRLTYAGELFTRARGRDRSLRLHAIRKNFHKQLQRLWTEHPVLRRGYSTAPVIDSTPMKTNKTKFGFNWRPIVTADNGLICGLDILMLRAGPPGQTRSDIDNRLKTIFDALRMPQSEEELGKGTSEGVQRPGPDENPFFVLLEDDRLITHLAVTSDMLLEPVEGCRHDGSVRLMIGVTVRPYNVMIGNVEFAGG